MRVKVRDHEGYLIELYQVHTHEYGLSGDVFNLALALEDNIVVYMNDVKGNEIKFVEE